jgi:hypothetical protein
VTGCRTSSGHVVATASNAHTGGLGRSGCDSASLKDATNGRRATTRPAVSFDAWVRLPGRVAGLRQADLIAPRSTIPVQRPILIIASQRNLSFVKLASVSMIAF